jgi:hypothetical protein
MLAGCKRCTHDDLISGRETIEDIQLLVQLVVSNSDV